MIWKDQLWSKRARRCLGELLGAHDDLSELCKYSAADILIRTHAGKITLEEIESRLNTSGLRLSQVSSKDRLRRIA